MNDLSYVPDSWSQGVAKQTAKEPSTFDAAWRIVKILLWIAFMLLWLGLCALLVYVIIGSLISRL